MRVVLGADHRGRLTLEHVCGVLSKKSIKPVAVFHDRNAAALDYTDVAYPVAVEVAAGRAEFGILICATGLGSSMAANKVPGVRAALVADELTAGLARRCLNANILCLGGHALGPAQLRRIVTTFLDTAFEGSGRHARRLEKLQRIESGVFDTPLPVMANADLKPA